MSDKSPDDADMAKAGTLPSDPIDGTVRAATPLRAVGPHERRQPDEPCNLEAEKALLGALLWAGTNQPAVLRVSAVIDLLEDGKPFYGAVAGKVYDAIRACHEAKQEHDPVAAHAEMMRQGHRLDLDKLRELVANASTVSETQARVYAQAIRNTWARREVIRGALALITRAKDPKSNVDEIISDAQSVSRMATERTACTSATVSVKESARAFFTDLEKGGSKFTPTGIESIDLAINGGLRAGEVTILAARTSVGKSLLSAQIAENIVSADPTAAVLYVTLEMSHKLFTARLVAARAGVPLSAIRRGVLNPTQWSRVTSIVGLLADKGLYFADSPSQTLASIHAAARERVRLLNREGRKLVLMVIDHIGLVKPSAELLKKASREQQVAETSRAQRVMAADLGCHVLGIAQIHREAERAPGNAMPKLHHLRESGSLEQDPDLVWILHRERDQKTGLFKKGKPPAFAIAKGRMDDTAIMCLDFDTEHARFADRGIPRDEWERDYADHYGVDS